MTPASPARRGGRGTERARRERARRALTHRPVERPPIDLGSTRVTGIAAWTYGELKQRLGLPRGETRVYDLSQFLAEVEEPVLDALDCDFLMLPLQVLPLELPRQGWKAYTFWDGRVYYVPEAFHPERAADGTLLVGHGAAWREPQRRMPPGSRYFDYIRYPDVVSVYDEVPHIREDSWPLPALFPDEYLRREQENARRLHDESDRALVSCGCRGMPAGYSGPIGWAMKMRSDPGHAAAFMMAEAYAYARRARQYLQAVGDCIDVLYVSGEDFGTQQGELFHPELFERFFVPAWRLVTQAIHEASPHVRVFVHSCGSVRRLLPHLVEAGVDIFNPVQWSARNMARQDLAREFGGKLVFWGGAVDCQATLPFGTPEEVRAEVAESIAAFSRRGGYVVAATHNIQADAPLDNVLALFEAARSASC